MGDHALWLLKNIYDMPTLCELQLASVMLLFLTKEDGGPKVRNRSKNIIIFKNLTPMCTHKPETLMTYLNTKAAKSHFYN